MRYRKRFGSFGCFLCVSLFIIWTASSIRGQLSLPLTRELSSDSYDNKGQLTYVLPYKHDLKTVCNISIHQRMDLMKMKPHSFITRFKNPCWYEGTELQCLPYVLLVGQVKCGTTDLFNRITLHPNFVKPFTKENDWLTSGRFFKQQTLSYYTSKVFSPLIKALSISNSTTLITGDGSPNILGGAVFWNYLGINVGHNEPLENNADYIHHLNRESKIIINVRNPVDRLWAEYLAFSKSKEKSAVNFHDIVQRVISIYNDCLRSRTVRACTYDNTLAVFATQSREEQIAFRHTCISSPTDKVKLHRGIYHVFIRDFLKVFPREQILIQRLEDISKDQNGSLLRTFEFLGLGMYKKGIDANIKGIAEEEKPPEERWQKILEQKVRNSRTASSRNEGDMLNSTRQLLYEFYKPHNEALADLLDNVDFNYGPMGG